MKCHNFIIIISLTLQSLHSISSLVQFKVRAVKALHSLGLSYLPLILCYRYKSFTHLSRYSALAGTTLHMTQIVAAAAFEYEKVAHTSVIPQTKTELFRRAFL